MNVLDIFPGLDFVSWNYTEAAFWILFGFAIVVVGLRSDPRWHRLALGSAFVFVLFGVTDVLEVMADAIWGLPLWLWVLKGVTGLGIVISVVLFLRKGL